MGWTDERIEVLTKLWADGKSASQIATALGGGVSRNAVIGKIHRLGLSGRAKVPAARAVRHRLALASGGNAGTAAMTGGGALMSSAVAAATAQPRAMAAGALAVKVVEREAPVELIRPAMLSEVVALHGGVTLFELSASTCRWPLGDPASDELRFCGGRTAPGDVYCRSHGEAAFPSRRKVRTQ